MTEHINILYTYNRNTHLHVCPSGAVETHSFFTGCLFVVLHWDWENPTCYLYSRESLSCDSL